ncbi:MAG: hypothetical protein NC311_17830 [Muribaculaceae bacterium]|nr:hypothetical protein [Muribaculaceae bacterium]
MSYAEGVEQAATKTDAIETDNDEETDTEKTELADTTEADTEKMEIADAFPAATGTDVESASEFAEKIELLSAMVEETLYASGGGNL